MVSYRKKFHTPLDGYETKGYDSSSSERNPETGNKKMATRKIVTTIEKLLRKAHGTDNQHEAEAFAAKAQELATRHKLEITEIAWDQEAGSVQTVGHEIWSPTDHGLKHKKARSLWKITLAEIVAQYNECAILTFRGSNKLWVSGAPQDRQVFSYVYAYLYREIESGVNRDYQRYRAECVREYGEWEAKQMIKGYRASWRQGFLSAIRKRFSEDRDRLLSEYETGTALVRLKDQLQKAKEYATAHSSGRSSYMQGRRAGNGVGSSDGASAGQKVSLRPGVGSGAGRKALT